MEYMEAKMQALYDGYDEAMRKNICPHCGLPDPDNNPYCFCANTFGKKSDDK